MSGGLVEDGEEAVLAVVLERRQVVEGFHVGAVVFELALELGGDKKFFARDETFFHRAGDAAAHVRLVAVRLCGVDVAVTVCDGVVDGLDDSVVIDKSGA